MIVKARKSRSFWHVTINGQTVVVAAWNGTVHVNEIDAIETAQRILVARRAK